MPCKGSAAARAGRDAKGASRLPPTLPNAAVSRKATPGTSPASSGDRMLKSEAKVYQKPKPSAVKPSAVRVDGEGFGKTLRTAGGASSSTNHPFVPEEEVQSEFLPYLLASSKPTSNPNFCPPLHRVPDNRKKVHLRREMA